MEVVQRALLAAFMKRPPDRETLHAVLDPDCVITTNWGSEQREHHGLEGHLDALVDMSAIWDSWEQDIERVLDAGNEHVVALMRFRATGHESGVPVESEWAIVSAVSDGRIVTSSVYLTHDEALKAAGLEK